MTNPTIYVGGEGGRDSFPTSSRSRSRYLVLGAIRGQAKSARWLIELRQTIISRIKKRISSHWQVPHGQKYSVEIKWHGCFWSSDRNAWPNRLQLVGGYM